jgi:hypothetical protein
MKEFYALLAENGYPTPPEGEGSLVILSVTTVTEGYVLVVRRSWTDGSVREDIVLVIENQYGRNKGQYRLGTRHKIFEHYVEEPPEPKIN